MLAAGFIIDHRTWAPGRKSDIDPAALAADRAWTPEDADMDAAQDKTLTETHDWTGQIGKRVPLPMTEILKPLQDDVDTLDRRTLYLQAQNDQLFAWFGIPPVVYSRDGVYPAPVAPPPAPPAPAPGA